MEILNGDMDLLEDEVLLIVSAVNSRGLEWDDALPYAGKAPTRADRDMVIVHDFLT